MLALAERLRIGLSEGWHQPSFRLVAGARAGSDNLPRLTWRWLIQIRMGDEEARRTFVEAWGPVIDQEVQRYAAKGGDGDELAAEGALALWEAATQYDPQRHKTSPERYIANHLHWRVRRRFREEAGYTRPAAVPLHLVELPPRTDERFSAIEQRLDLAAVVEALAPTEQAAFARYLQFAGRGLGPDEAARMLAHQEGGSFAAWKKRLERVRHKVREYLR